VRIRSHLNEVELAEYGNVDGRLWCLVSRTWDDLFLYGRLAVCICIYIRWFWYRIKSTVRILFWELILLIINVFSLLDDWGICRVCEVVVHSAWMMHRTSFSCTWGTRSASLCPHTAVSYSRGWWIYNFYRKYR
jgi:hypothetical protein